MKRRTYLATATAAAATVAGCSALTGSETSDDENGDDDDGNGSSDPVNEEPGSFDEFEDLSKWTVEEGSLSADEDRVYAGTQSARMDADGSTERIMIKREFDTPRDLSDEFPALAFASDHDVSPTVQLTDTDGDRLLLQCAVREDGPFVHHDLGVLDTDGDPDLGSIEHTKISVWAGDRELSLWCDDYHFVGRPETGKVMLQFPESTPDVADGAGPLLAEYDVPGTAFVSTDYVGSSGYLSHSDLESLQDDGWIVASGGATGTDLTQHGESRQEEEFSRAAEWLADNGFDDAYYSYGLNRYDESSLELAKEYSDIAFVGGYAGHGNLSNPHLAPRATNPDPADAAQLIEWTADYRLITTLSYRNVGESLDELEAVLSALDDHDVDVVTPDDIAADNLH
ncbi:polysaccharide deacetylase family protein [Natronorubrum texcoconense]|uniref:Peptidoglycan/xylan/chitin deacetylase, PgdA/CDA1 family n=1 Tax=Natronorubrum texcoconense TaxID=1095776 RepID=A0A1G9BHI2_9EURY|nr:polysaccharide deacetylase family protein [Natronorubrum texcoconense]SDK38923.1 Peptidoglycan/xylan/chitin deacetylase, PgdA/CDA1 family [Natronorubrum texcoconense]